MTRRRLLLAAAGLAGLAALAAAAWALRAPPPPPPPPKAARLRLEPAGPRAARGTLEVLDQGRAEDLGLLERDAEGNLSGELFAKLPLRARAVTAHDVTIEPTPGVDPELVAACQRLLVLRGAMKVRIVEPPR